MNASQDRSGGRAENSPAGRAEHSPPDRAEHWPPDPTGHSPAGRAGRLPAGRAAGRAEGRGDLRGVPDAVPVPTAPVPGELIGAAERLFGAAMPGAAAYADLLATEGVVRGLIGPREAPRIWERHLLNCAAIAELIPPGASVVDVGSGAGLPGIVLAVARPDITVTLVEPLARRTAFLTEAVTALGLASRVTVLRARAEELAGGALTAADIVTARAVAPLDRLAGWCLPLAAVGGRLLALKGESAADEVAAHRDAVGRLGGSTPVVRRCGVGLIDPPTTVVEIVRERYVAPPRSRSPRGTARLARKSTSDGRGGRATPPTRSRPG